MKKILVIVTLSMLMSNFSSANNGCSSYKMLSKEYFKCIAGMIKKKSSNIGLDTHNIKEKKYLTDFFKKKN